MTDLNAALMALAESDNRSLTRRLADVLPAIEHALAAGVSRRLIVQTLGDEGLVVTVRQLDKALYRLRREPSRKRDLARVPGLPASPSSPASAAIEPAAHASPLVSHDPKAIDQIMRQRPDLNALARQARKLRPSP